MRDTRITMIAIILLCLISMGAMGTFIWGCKYTIEKVITYTSPIDDYINLNYIDKSNYDFYQHTWHDIFKDNYPNKIMMRYSSWHKYAPAPEVFRNAASNFITRNESYTYVGKYFEQHNIIHPDILDAVIKSELFSFECIVDNDKKIACFVNGIAKRRFNRV